MTESLRSGKRRREIGDLESTGVEPDRTESVLTVPVGGLASGAALADWEPLGGPVARGSVVDALRRQVIRRSGKGEVMDLSEDSDVESGNSDSEEETYQGTVEQAADEIVTWLRGKAGKATNYTVAACDGKLYITKVNGVTEATALMGELKDYIQELGIDDYYHVYLCQRYTTAVGSNHAEMCLVAAVGRDNLSKITFLECTAASCHYCAAFLQHYKVPNSSPATDPASQAGWAHPFDSVFWGTQLGDHWTQVGELGAYLKNSKTKLQIGRHTLTAPAGRCEHWL